jgi:hypothetical protein
MTSRSKGAEHDSILGLLDDTAKRYVRGRICSQMTALPVRRGLQK